MKTLLLVDDEKCLTESMKELLESNELHILTADNGEQALQILLLQHVDCIVSDIKMPVMDGLTFLRRTRELGFTTPFIFFSGHACDKLEKITKDLGALDLLTKPQFDELEKVILSVVKPLPTRALAFTDHF